MFFFYIHSTFKVVCGSQLLLYGNCEKMGEVYLLKIPAPNFSKGGQTGDLLVPNPSVASLAPVQLSKYFVSQLDDLVEAEVS